MPSFVDALYVDLGYFVDDYLDEPTLPSYLPAEEPPATVNPDGTAIWIPDPPTTN